MITLNYDIAAFSSYMWGLPPYNVFRQSMKFELQSCTNLNQSDIL